MDILENRLNSFSFGCNSWPLDRKRFKATPETLSAAGFFYAPGKKCDKDNGKCFLCSKQLGGWEPNDDPFQEHVSHSSICPLTKLHEADARKETFKKTFASNNGTSNSTGQQGIKKRGQTHLFTKLADAGFFYWPVSNSVLDTIVCFSCGFSLSNWIKDIDTSSGPCLDHKCSCKGLNIKDLAYGKILGNEMSITVESSLQSVEEDQAENEDPVDDKVKKDHEESLETEIVQKSKKRNNGKGAKSNNRNEEANTIRRSKRKSPTMDEAETDAEPSPKSTPLSSPVSATHSLAVSQAVSPSGSEVSVASSRGGGRRTRRNRNDDELVSLEIAPAPKGKRKAVVPIASTSKTAMTEKDLSSNPPSPTGSDVSVASSSGLGGRRSRRNQTLTNEDVLMSLEMVPAPKGKRKAAAAASATSGSKRKAAKTSKIEKENIEEAGKAESQQEHRESTISVATSSSSPAKAAPRHSTVSLLLNSFSDDRYAEPCLFPASRKSEQCMALCNNTQLVPLPLTDPSITVEAYLRQMVSENSRIFANQCSSLRQKLIADIASLRQRIEAVQVEARV